MSATVSGVDIDQEVDIAVGAIVAAHPLTEQSGMSYATLAQGLLVLPKAVENLLPVHCLYLKRDEI